MTDSKIVIAGSGIQQYLVQEEGKDKYLYVVTWGFEQHQFRLPNFTDAMMSESMWNEAAVDIESVLDGLLITVKAPSFLFITLNPSSTLDRKEGKCFISRADAGNVGFLSRQLEKADRLHLEHIHDQLINDRKKLRAE